MVEGLNGRRSVDYLCGMWQSTTAAFSTFAAGSSGTVRRPRVAVQQGTGGGGGGSTAPS